MVLEDVYKRQVLTECRRRQDITLTLAQEFLNKSQKSCFTPFGVAHGWNKNSYRQSVEALSLIHISTINFKNENYHQKPRHRSYFFKMTGISPLLAATLSAEKRIKDFACQKMKTCCWDCARALMDIVEPVSYTHLDVYKRQALNQLKDPTHSSSSSSITILLWTRLTLSLIHI